jgi:hypothetical protein
MKTWNKGKSEVCKSWTVGAREERRKNEGAEGEEVI